MSVAAMLAVTLVATACDSSTAPPPPSRDPPPPVGARPLGDSAASARVVRSAWEPRPENARADARKPTAAQVRAFRAQSEMPYARWVDGRYSGTTDEIIQWAAAKWRLDADLLRAVAATESWWRMRFVGDDGDSFGLFQIRRPYHCRGSVCDLARRYTAFNADYYAATVRAYYDGKQRWLKSVSGNGRPYRAGDLWGSIGAWYSGRWHDAGAEAYVARVGSALAARVWTLPSFSDR